MIIHVCLFFHDFDLFSWKIHLEYMFSIQRLKLTQVYMFFQALLVFSYISLSTFTCLWVEKSMIFSWWNENTNWRKSLESGLIDN